MRSSGRWEAVEVLDGLRGYVKRAVDVTFDALTTPERLAVLEAVEVVRRSCWRSSIR